MPLLDPCHIDMLGILSHNGTDVRPVHLVDIVCLHRLLKCDQVGFPWGPNTCVAPSFLSASLLASIGFALPCPLTNALSSHLRYCTNSCIICMTSVVVSDASLLGLSLPHLTAGLSHSTVLLTAFRHHGLSLLLLPPCLFASNCIGC